MSSNPPPVASAPGGAAPAPKRKTFVPRSSIDRLPVDAAVRQGRATSLAFTTFGGLGPALAFLNTHDDALGGRPIDLAVASANGLEAVSAAIRAKASPSPVVTAEDGSTGKAFASTQDEGN